MNRYGSRWNRASRADRPAHETTTFRESVRRNAVALISLTLAITSLSYAAWRGETSEVQRNHREGAFRILVEIGELREVILHRSYFLPRVAQPARAAVPEPSNWIMGWGKAMMIRDLSSVLPDPLPERGQQLFESWETSAGRLHAEDQESRQRATDALLERLDEVRDATVQLVHDLG